MVSIFNCSSVQLSRSVVSESLRPHGLLHARLPCPSPTPGACSNSCPSNQWCHTTISSTVIPFSAFNLSQNQDLFQRVSSSHQVWRVISLIDYVHRLLVGIREETTYPVLTRNNGRIKEILLVDYSPRKRLKNTAYL